MFEAASALNGASFDGYVSVAEQGLRGMITLRGDLRADALAKVVRKITGVAVPGKGTVAIKGERGVCWMSPDELLILVHTAMPQRRWQKSTLHWLAAIFSLLTYLMHARYFVLAVLGLRK